MSGGGGGPVGSVMAQINTANKSGPGEPTPGYIAPSQLSQGPVYQPAFNSQQNLAPMQTGPTTGGPGPGPMNHMVQPDPISPMTLPYQPTPIGQEPPLGSTVGSTNTAFQPPAPQQISPFVQQMMRQQSMFNPMQQGSGLQAALMQMLSRQNQPMMRPQMRQMPQYRSPALGFRPNMQQAQQNLNRVQPSVYKTDLDNARARIAELEAQQAIYKSNGN